MNFNCFYFPMMILVFVFNSHFKDYFGLNCLNLLIFLLSGILRHLILKTVNYYIQSYYLTPIFQLDYSWKSPKFGNIPKNLFHLFQTNYYNLIEELNYYCKHLKQSEKKVDNKMNTNSWNKHSHQYCRGILLYN